MEDDKNAPSWVKNRQDQAQLSTASICVARRKWYHRVQPVAFRNVMPRKKKGRSLSNQNLSPFKDNNRLLRSPYHALRQRNEANRSFMKSSTTRFDEL